MNWTDEAEEMLKSEEKRRRQEVIDLQSAAIRAKEVEQEVERRKLDGMSKHYWKICKERFEEIEALLSTQRNDRLLISKPAQGFFTVENDRDIGRAKPFVVSHRSEYMGGHDWYRDIYQVYGIIWKFEEVESGIQMTIFLGVKATQKWVKKGIFPFCHEEMEYEYVPSVNASEVEIKVKEWLKGIYRDRLANKVKAPSHKWGDKKEIDSSNLL